LLDGLLKVCLIAQDVQQKGQAVLDLVALLANGWQVMTHGMPGW
jgi:hypothetical protein